MNIYKDLYNEAINNSSFRKLSGEELKSVQKCVLDIYKHVASVCKKNGLMIMLGGWSVLGAVRHKGFIPWDDDMDLNMPRADYDKLIELCKEGVLGDKYDFAYPNKMMDASSAFLKIYRMDTEIIGLEGPSSKYPNCLKIDIFPIEGTSSNKCVRHIKGWTANIIRLIGNMVDESSPWNQIKKELYSRNLRFYIFMRCRQLLGRIFSIVEHKQWICWYDRYVKNPIIGDVVVIPTGRQLYNGETLPSSVFFPVSKGIFEGIEVNLPADPDAYLTNLYGDYMQIPPENKRESHLIIDLQLPKQFYKSTSVE